MTRLEFSSSTPLGFPGWPVFQATPSTTEEDAAEEEEGPGGNGEPDGVTDHGATTSAVYPGLCQEKEGEIENEGNHSHSCGKTRNAGTATCHGHFSDVREETEYGRSRGQSECDDVKDKAISYPFDNNVGDFDLCVISE